MPAIAPRWWQATYMQAAPRWPESNYRIEITCRWPRETKASVGAMRPIQMSCRLLAALPPVAQVEHLEALLGQRRPSGLHLRVACPAGGVPVVCQSVHSCCSRRCRTPSSKAGLVERSVDSPRASTNTAEEAPLCRTHRLGKFRRLVRPAEACQNLRP